MSPSRSPLHIIVGPDTHGVTRHALGLLAQRPLAGHRVHRIEGFATDADPADVWRDLPEADLTHLHLTDHLLAGTAGECADLVVALARRRRLSLTLHDLPQPADGPGRYERRRHAYARMAAAACGVIVASEHERGLLARALGQERRGPGGPVRVVPLPLQAPGDPGARPGRAGEKRGRDLVVFGYLYPGKGHAPALEALPRLPDDVGVVALGAPSPGHDALVDELTRRAGLLGRRIEITGHVDDAELPARLRSAGVPVAPHEHVSASGSIGSWIAAGRRPLVPAGPYADELAARCPGAVLRYGPGTAHPDLAAAAAAALADPALTWLDAGVTVGPTPRECAQRYADLLTGWSRPPSIRVVVPHYDDEARLRLVLAALQAQRGVGAVEVVVADDGSPHAPALPDTSLPVRLVRQEDRGFRAAAARNLGAAAATRPGHGASVEPADVLVFLDGDTVPVPDFLHRLSAGCLDAARDGRGLAVGHRRHAHLSDLTPPEAVAFVAAEGATRPELVLPEPAWLAQGYAATDDLREADERSYRFVISAVLALTRRLWDDLGGFDEQFTAYGGEDWELANRAWLAGAGLRHVPDALAWHDGPDAAGRAEQGGPPTAAAAEAARAARVAETLRVAAVVTEPRARDPRLFWQIPDVCIELDDTGWTTTQVLLVAADLLAGTDARIWLRQGRVLAEGSWPPADPRVAQGPPPPSVTARARYRVGVDAPVRLAEPLAALCARGQARYRGLTVRSTRAVALGNGVAEGDEHLVTPLVTDSDLQAEWDWRRRGG